MALCLRFRPKNTYRGPLCINELDEAETRIIKIIQTHSFSCEVKELTHGRETHEKHYHTGIQTTLYMIRQKFWLLDGRNQVRKIVRSCIRCFLFNADTVNYKMGDLPKNRVRDAFPFTNTGIDFCGPFYVKEKKYRNRNQIKAYVCVFICMVVKAVHLEVVSDLTTDGFLAALRRFVSRRGVPTHIHSDNGTNFVGANNKLKELYGLFNSDEHKNKINQFSLEHRVTWHFICHSHCSTFRWTMGIHKIEGILNSRPISSLSSDPNDLLTLTPAHFLIGKSLNNLPELDFSSVPANRLSAWQHTRKVRQDFWARWSLEYLNELQIRHKWIKDGENITIGMVVLVKDKGLPCLQWALGKVLEIYPGEDGIPRTVTIETRTGVVKRSSTSDRSIVLQ
ncbi:PREDICTED: uncharacterized protein LOC108782610 [Cyphomyrmex costatus]|uniref:uncharacterized protein LOC108782610 n=1 Tax=Cyphomyrmex costatus TaxID=456900 RepID=UPI000852377A|nr:PREDICTED: uncharacterized protein LOC108782610 [Cyphomyrmex costatus]